MAVFDTIVLVGLILQNPSAVEAQGKPSTSAAPRDPSLDRIRSRLAEPPSISVPASTPPFTTSASDRPLFRVHIEVSNTPLWDWLGTTETIVPTYVRPTFTLTHHEFLLGATPELFRGPTTHPAGVPVLSVARAIVNAARGPLKRRKEAKARQEVADAIAANEAAKKKPPEQ